MKRIILDMMGGDLSPAETVKGVCLAAQELEPAHYLLVGDREAILRAAREESLSLDGMELVDAPSVVTMEDDAQCVIRSKADSSMAIGLRMLADGRGDAFVSTGNTGALFTGANLLVRKVKGIRRPAIAALLPMQPPVLLVDSGANIQVTPEYLEQFAVMGTVYMKRMFSLSSPRVGLLNNGSEEQKGTRLQQETYRLLSENPSLNFVGNVEGNRVMQNACDVLVADGFTGNVFLKTMEGMGKLMLVTMKDMFYAGLQTKFAALLCRKQIGSIKKKFDAREFGGAPILGVSKPVIKAHGSSDAKAFKNAIRQAMLCADLSVTEEISAQAQEWKAWKKEMASREQASETIFVKNDDKKREKE
ncbi:MAG: phosphate acyltransferase PlsX [Clostridia bacterium]|nr:phosphate acyltransferase PlsX [Clostridia bacterium]